MVSTEWLKKTDLFGALNEIQLKIILSHSVEKTFAQGETIFHKGETANHLYILIQGEVDLSVQAEEEIGIMASKVEKEGAVFGTPSLTEPFHYNVTAKCLKPTTLLTLEADPIKKEMENDPKMGLEIMKKLSSIYFNRLNDLRSGVSNLIKFLKIKTK